MTRTYTDSSETQLDSTTIFSLELKSTKSLFPEISVLICEIRGFLFTL